MDKTSLANYALSKLGDTPMLDLTDDSAKARLATRTFDQIRDAELRRVPWTFSIKRAQLVTVGTGPLWGYANQYPLPADYLALVQVNDFYVRSGNKQRTPWAIEQLTDGSGAAILTDLPAPLKIRYVSRVTNTGLFDPLFCEALACKLAMEWCETLTQSDTKFQRVTDQYKYAMSEAKRQSAVEGPPDEVPWGSWLGAREGESVIGAATPGDSTQFPSGTTVL